MKLIVRKTNSNIDLQIFSEIKKKIIISCSSKEKIIKLMLSKKTKKNKTTFTAYILGKVMALRSLNIKIDRIKFDSSGYKFHGKIKKICETFNNFYKC